mgnify:FL=1
MQNQLEELIKIHLGLLNKELKRLSLRDYTNSVIAKIHYIGLVKQRLNVMLGEHTVDGVMEMQEEETAFLDELYESGLDLSGYLAEIIERG